MTEGHVIDRIEKNANTEIRCVIQEFNRQEYIHLRIYQRQSSDGEFKPTKKGIAVHIDDADKLLDMMRELAKELKRRQDRG